MVGVSPQADHAMPASDTRGGVLIITTNFPPNRQAGTHRLLRFARYLDELGWRVTVLTLDPAAYRPGVPLDDRLTAEVPPEVRVVRTLVPGRKRLVTSTDAGLKQGNAVQAPRRPEGAVKRRMRRLWQQLTSTPDHDLAWALAAVPAGMRVVKEGEVDVILSSAPPFTTHLIAAEIARRSRLPWVADFRDPWSRAPWGLEWRNKGWTGVVHRRLERLTIERATRVVLNTPQMQEDFAAHYAPGIAAKFSTLPNGFDREQLDRSLRPVARTAGQDTVVLCHTGSLYQARDPRPLFRALASLRAAGELRPDAFLLQLVGGTGGEFDAPGEVRRLGLEDVVQFVPPVSHGESLGYLRAADVLVVVQPDTKVQVPVKLYEYLWAQKPILALASEGAVADLITNGHVGQVVPADDEEAIAAALRSFYRHRATLADDYAAPAEFLHALEGRQLSMRLHRMLLELTA
jgi:glycosyltransferase involved in cell wall biosynthesis